jgi:putative membrane protein insertion efficiency factor
MMRLKFYFILCCFFATVLLTGKLAAQSKEEIAQMSKLMDVPVSHSHYLHYRWNGNIPQYISGNLFDFYKNFFSSQDGNSCTFSPSCSAYGLQSVRKEGLFEGMLSTFDRLCRCNNLNRDQYDKVPGSRLLYDPVE